MFKIFKKEKFPTKLFVTASLLALALAFVFLLFLKINLQNLTQPDNKLIDDKLFLKSSKGEDPFVTSVPSLSQSLDGPIISQDDPFVGKIEAPVSVVIFSDFQCKFCKNQEEIIKELIKKYADKVSLLWKDYPELDKKSFSWRAAVAARCAQEQGKFWEYHDLLFSRDQETSEDFFVSLADELELRSNTFKECLYDNEIGNLVYSNILEAQTLEIYGIPFIYVNNKEVMGEASYEDLQKVIEEELER